MSCITATVMGIMTTCLICAEATITVKEMSTVTFQTEIVVTILEENVCLSLLGRIVMASQITRFVAVMAKSIRILAKPISKAGRVFKIRAAASMLLLSNGLICCRLVDCGK